MLISPNFSLDQARRAIRVNGRFGLGGCDRDKLSRMLVDWATHLVGHWLRNPGPVDLPYLARWVGVLTSEKRVGKEEIFFALRAIFAHVGHRLSNAVKRDIENTIEKVGVGVSPTLSTRYDPLERLAVLSLREAIGPLERMPPAHAHQIAQDVPGLIRAIEDGEPVHPILADALEDSGYAHEAVLAHLRHAPHVFPGLPCWAISVVLNRHPFQRAT